MTRKKNSSPQGDPARARFRKRLRAKEDQEDYSMMVSETSSAKRRSLRDKNEVADVDESGDSDEESSGAPEGSVRSAGSESRSATPVPLGRKPTPKLIANKIRVLSGTE